LAYYVRIETKFEFDWLAKMLHNAVIKTDSSPGHFSPELDAAFRSLDLSMKNPIIAEEIAVTKEVEVIKKQRVQKAVVAPIVLCETHRNYQAKRSPRTDCQQCWTAYKKFNPMSTTKQRARRLT
jgi:hypothetical protein